VWGGMPDLAFTDIEGKPGKFRINKSSRASGHRVHEHELPRWPRIRAEPRPAGKGNLGASRFPSCFVNPTADGHDHGHQVALKENGLRVATSTPGRQVDRGMGR